MNFKETDNPYKATYFKYIGCRKDAKLENCKIYPILSNFCGEEMYKYIQAGDKAYTLEWLDNYCAGEFLIEVDDT